MTSYVWPVVFSTFFGIGCGALCAYQFPHYLVNKAQAYSIVGIVFLSIPFTIYFSIEKNPLFTNLFYFIPAFGVVYTLIGSLIVQQHVESEDAVYHETIKKKRRQKEFIQEEMSLDDLYAEKRRRYKQRKYESQIGSISDKDLDKRIKDLRNKNRM